MNASRAPASVIRIRGARQHNLKNLDLDLPRSAMTVITGVSGSGKSSLAFDTLYAEGQRRYVESVSTYAKQFLDRLPRPDVDAVHGLTPAVAIRQVSAARSARSTVATATEIHDHLRLLFARLGTVHCVSCGQVVSADSPASIARESAGWPDGEPLLVLAELPIPKGSVWAELAGHLLAAGYTRIRRGEGIVELDPVPKLPRGTTSVSIVVDRFTWRKDETPRLVESLEQAFRRGSGRLTLQRGDRAPETRSERWECSHCGTPALEPEPALFSFNSPLGVCPTCRGFGNVLTFTLDRIVPDPTLTLKEGALRPWAGTWNKVFGPKLEAFARAEGIALDQPWSKLAAGHRRMLIEGAPGFRGAIPFLERLQKKSYKAGNRFIVKKYQTALPCTECGGARLRAEALRVTLGGRSIAEVLALPIAEAQPWLQGLTFTAEQREVADSVMAQLDARLRFLLRVDLGYLALDRMTRTLSGGEAQRIELANALGAQLTDTLYVLDEPTVGLHPRDSRRLTELLFELAQRGNTLVVVEHEPILMRAADHLVDLGPGAGVQGGHVLWSGPGRDVDGAPTETARFLRGEKQVTRRRRDVGTRFVTVVEATHHNLDRVTARFPIGALTAVTGVSGSGKSSLVEDILFRVASDVLGEPADEPAGTHREVRGLDAFQRVVLVDQSPIGRTPRSCPVSYLGAYAPLREVFARQPLALARGLADGAFSFNTAGGRCEACEGAGWVTVEMYFLADLLVPCEVCGGARFRPEVLEVRYRGANIQEALGMTADQAFEHFGREVRFTRALQTMRRVGLGYLTLGQPATQLSGGEAQRLKIARELAVRAPRGSSVPAHALYVLDEPTVGLHFLDVQRLLDVLTDLTDRGDTVVVVEHNLDVVRNADWVVDLGPDGGDRGGRLVVEGPPEVVAGTHASRTGEFLREDRARVGGGTPVKAAHE